MKNPALIRGRLRPVSAARRFGRLCSCSLAVLSVAGLSAGALPASAATTAQSTEEFLNLLGVNTHLDGNSGWSTDATLVGQQMAYIGVRLQRDWPTSTTATGAAFHTAQLQNPLGRLWTSIAEASPAGQRTALGYCQAIYNTYGSGLVYAMGGPNEEDDPYPQGLGARLPDSALVQQELYDWAHPLGIKVSQMEFGAGWTAANNWQGDYNPANPGINYTKPANGDQTYTPGAADFGGAHPYLINTTSLPGARLATLRALARLTTPGKPVAHTEWGAYTSSGLSPAVFGQYMVMGAFDSAAAGDSAYIIYGLQDGAIEGTYGFFTAAGAENPVATYFHNLSTVLQCDTPALRYAPGQAATFAPGALNVSYSNTSTVSHRLLQKPTGEFVIAAYSEQLMNGAQSAVSDTIDFGQVFQSVSIYDVETGATPIQTLSNVSSCALTLNPSDTYLIVLANDPVTGPPATPSGLAVTARAAQVSCTWASVSGATGYTLKRAASPAGPFTVLASGLTATSYTDTSVGNTAGYYVIAATNSFGSSADSTPVAPTVIIDNADASGVVISGTWYASANAPGYYGSNYIYTSGGGQSVSFTPNLIATTYTVYARWTANANRAPDVPVDITSSDGTSTVHVNQQTGGGAWVSLGSFAFAAGSTGSVRIRTDGTSGAVVADAIEFVPAAVGGPAELVAPQNLSEIVGDGQITLRWDAVPGATHYNIQRATSEAGPFTVVGGGVAGIEFTDTGLSDGTTYFYKVGAVDGAGAGPDSAVANATPQPATLVMDNADAAGVAGSGSWATGAGVSGYYGTNYLSAGTVAQSGPCRVTFTPDFPSAGVYAVYARWTAAANRALHAPFDVNFAGGTRSVTMNEQVDNGTWRLLGSFPFDAGAGGSVVVRNTGADGYVVADAVAFVLQPPVDAQVQLEDLARTYDGTARAIAVTTRPAGLSVAVTYAGETEPPAAAGAYPVIATIIAPGYRGTATGTLVIHKASAALVLGKLSQRYDGTPRTVTVETQPVDLAVDLVYDGAAIAPTLPGAHGVTATVRDANYEGTAAGTLMITTTALVRHAPVVNGGLDGSVQVLRPESTTLNGGAWISGDLLVPGTPGVRLNGQPVFAGVLDAGGVAAPASATITLDGGAVLRYVVRRVDAGTLPLVDAPPPPAGSRDIVIDHADTAAVDFATLRNLTLNGDAGSLSVPAGTYGDLVVNSGARLLIGTAGASDPAVYNLQALTLNGDGAVSAAGPVVLHLAHGVVVNGALGTAAHPEWLTVAIAAGDLTLNGHAAVHGDVVVPDGAVMIGGQASLEGRVSCDRLTINGAGRLSEPAL